MLTYYSQGSSQFCRKKIPDIENCLYICINKQTFTLCLQSFP